MDPFCGSGTIPLEAAMMAVNMAPGMNREFLAQRWDHLIGKREWYDAVDEAAELIDMSVDTDIQGYDIDDKMIAIARQNAKLAGVETKIHFQRRPLSMLSHPKKYGFLITNPPYGERLSEKEALPELYHELGERFAALDSWSMYVITAYENAQRDIAVSYTHLGAQKDRLYPWFRFIRHPQQALFVLQDGGGTGAGNSG